MDDATELATLREEVAALRADLTAMQPPPPEREPISRRGLLMGLAGAAGVATLAGAPPAGADDGDNLILGQDNVSTSTTSLALTRPDSATDKSVGLRVESDGHASIEAISRHNPDLDYRPTTLYVENESTRFGAWAIQSVAKDGFCLYGTNSSSVFPAVAGVNDGSGAGLGGGSSVGGPQLYLEPGDSFPNGPPTIGPQAVGEIRLDAVGDLWVCVASGDPGTWTRLLREDTAAGRTVPITPLRALDTRAVGGKPAGSPVVPGQKQGPLKGGTSLTLDLAGVGAIPATATGVAGNLTVVSPTYSGYLSARPSDAPNTTSSINFTTGAIVANAVTSGLGPDGLTITGSGTAANSYHLIVDITAYLT